MTLLRLKNDGKPELVLNELQKKMKKQVDTKVEEGNYQFETIICPICNSEEKETVGSKDRYGLYFPTNTCKSCGLVYTSPRMNQTSYNEFYNSEYRKLYVGTKTATETFFNQQRSKGKRIYTFLEGLNTFKSEPLLVLEVGCGAGGILDYFREKGHRVKGVDLGEEYIRYGKNKHQLDLLTGTLKDVPKNEQPDLIIYSHVLEHILDLHEEIELIKQFVNKNTTLYIEVPGIKEIHKNYESNILRYFQNAHTFHFTLESLVNLMTLHGFELIGGNQFVKSAFRHTEAKAAISNDYDAVSTYIERIERRRAMYPLTVPGLKGNLKKVAVGILNQTRVRKIIGK